MHSTPHRPSLYRHTQSRLARLLAAGIACLVTLNTPAAEAEHVSRQLAETLSQAYSTCAAYYSLLSRMAAEAGDAGSVTLQNGLRDKAITYALTYARKLHGEQAREVTTGLISTAVDAMFAAAGSDPGRFDALRAQHDEPCTAAMRDPAAFADNMLEKTVGH
jgi:hypothetical protein